MGILIIGSADILASNMFIFNVLVIGTVNQYSACRINEKRMAS